MRNRTLTNRSALLVLMSLALLQPVCSVADDTVSGDQTRVRALLHLHLTDGQRVPYRAVQTTRLLEGRIIETTQIVTRAGRDRERIEYLSPPHLRGEVILRLGARMFHYKPRPEPQVTESSAPAETRILRLREVMAAIRSGTVEIKRIGEQVVAGHRSEIVEIRPTGPGPVRRLWIDPITGVRLRHETVDSRATVTASTYFTSLVYRPRINPEDFSPEAIVRLAPSTILPGAVRIGSVQAAQARVAFRIKVPELPDSFALKEVWMIGPRGDRGVALVYSDGVNTIRVTQRRLPRRAVRRLWDNTSNAPVIRPGYAYWVVEDMLYTIAGPMRVGLLQRAMRSLQ